MAKEEPEIKASPRIQLRRESTRIGDDRSVQLELEAPASHLDLELEKAPHQDLDLEQEQLDHTGQSGEQMHAKKQSDDLRENSKHGSEENEELGPTIDSDKINRLHAKGQQGLAKGGRSFEEVH